MAKVIQTGDLHFGVPGRLQDIVWAARVMREYAYRHDIFDLFCLGDLFNNRQALELDAVCAAFDFFEESKKKYGQKWVVFPGNHDMFLKHSWTVNALKPLSKSMTIISDVKIVKMDEVRFWILPFIHFERAYMHVLKLIEAQYQPGDVLLTHIGILGAVKNVCFLLKDWSLVSFHDSPFTQVYAGHFHVPQQVGNNVWYTGSPIPFKFDEGDSSHGFYVYDLETRTHEFVDIWEVGAQYFPNEAPPPNYLTVSDDALSTISHHIIDHNIIRVATTRMHTANEQEQIEKHLLTLGAAAVRWINIAGEEELEQARSKIAANNNKDAFEIWLQHDADNIKDLNVALLRQLNRNIVKEGNERYEYIDED